MATSKTKNDKKISHAVHFRINNANTIELIKDCIDTGKFKSNNELYNRCLEIALPQILENTSLSSEYVKGAFKSLEQKLLKKFDTDIKALKKTIMKELIIQNVNQAMTSSLLQAFLMFAESNGVKISNDLIEDFADNLPDFFATMFYNLSETLSENPPGDNQ